MKPKTASNPDHKRLIEEWCNAYRKKFGVPYVFQGGKDGAAVKSLLASGIAVELAIGTAVKAWNKPRSQSFWRCNTQASKLSSFVASFNDITVELANENGFRKRDYENF